MTQKRVKNTRANIPCSTPSGAVDSLRASADSEKPAQPSRTCGLSKCGDVWCKYDELSVVSVLESEECGSDADGD